jgi:anti-sigma factor RsiW
VGRYLTAYADDELEGGLKRRVERHLERCSECARELDSIREFDRILEGAKVPPVTAARWEGFGRELSLALDRVDREPRVRSKVREARPVYGSPRRRAFAVAGACAVVALVVLAIGPGGFFRTMGDGAVTDGSDCIVESIETFASGYTPMSFTSHDPEMTVIWVFSDEVEGGLRGEGPGAM